MTNHSPFMAMVAVIITIIVTAILIYYLIGRLLRSKRHTHMLFYTTMNEVYKRGHYTFDGHGRKCMIDDVRHVGGQSGFPIYAVYGHEVEDQV